MPGGIDNFSKGIMIEARMKLDQRWHQDIKEVNVASSSVI